MHSLGRLRLAFIFLVQSLLVRATAIGFRGTGGDLRAYDYVVVGGGTAGIAVATRLAQMSFTVALVEAGGYYQGISLASLPSSDLFRVGSRPRFRTPIDWGFVAEPQPGANMRSIHFARGRCLGGS